MADNDIEIRVKVDAQGAITVLDSLGGELTKVEKGAKNAGDGFSSTQAKLVTFNTTLLTVVDSLPRLASGLVGILERGSKVDDIASSFDNLATRAGASGDALLNGFGNALGNTIPKVDLMQRANELMLGGLDPSKFDLVAKAARQFAEVTGGSAKQGMDALSDSLLRGNDRALRTIGITVDNKKVLDEFAASIGTTADKLNEVGRVEAMRLGMLKALEEQSSKLGDVTDDAGDKVDQLKASWQNEFDQVSRNIANNETLLGVLGDLIKMLGATSDIITETIRAFQGLDTQVNIGVKFLKDYAINLLTTSDGLTAYRKTMLEGAAAQLKANTETANLTKAEKIQTTELGMLDKAMGLVSKNLNFTSTSTARSTSAFIDHNRVTADAAKNADKYASALDKQIDENDKLIKSQQSLIDKAKELNSPSGIQGLADSFAEAQIKGAELGLTQEDIDRSLSVLVEKALAGGISFDHLGVAAENSAKKVAEASDKIGEAANKIESDLRQALTEAGANAIKSLGDAMLNGASSQELKNIGEQLGGSIGSSLGTAAAMSIGQPELAPLFSAIGEVAGEALVKGIESFFGGDNAGTKFRKSVDKFFADAFDANRLQVIIDGQLQEISDLDFSGSNFGSVTSGFFDAFNGLGDAAKAAFSGVAQGFSELLGQGEEFASSLAAALANNVGGSLNNLQLLVQASGKSFEQLHDSVVEAFLDGKLSALEAQTALIGIQNISEKGIPGAIGATVEAFNNLQAAGVKGGRASTDAIRDIADEAKELHIKTLPELTNYLVNTGKLDAKAVGQVFDALKDQGLDSIDAISGATDERLIPVLSALEAAGFPFKDAADAAADFASSVKDIPSEKTFVLNVKVNGSAEDKNIISQAAGRGVFNNARGEGFAIQ